MLCRGRVVTRADLQTAALAFDRRILAAIVDSRVERGPDGLGRVARLWLSLDAEGFTDRELELPALRQGLTRVLEGKLVEGTRLDVRFEWSRP